MMKAIKPTKKKPLIKKRKKSTATEATKITEESAMTNKKNSAENISAEPVSVSVSVSETDANNIPEAVIINQPGDDSNLPAVVDPLVEAAVNKINELVGNSLLDMSLAVGRYVLEAFFDNDIAEARSRSPKKQHSYRKLQNHPGLKIHFKTLSLMVNVAIQETILLETIKPEKLDSLTYSHRVELLVADDFNKLALANKCIDEQLTIKQIRKEISNAKNKPAYGKKKFIDPFIQDIIDKYSNKEFSVGDIKWTRIDMIKKMQAKINEYLNEIEKTKEQLKVSKINLQLIYDEKDKSKKNKTVA
jgi:hypothetical protein